MKKFLLLLFVVILYVQSNAQEDAQLSMYTSSPLLINPATTGYFQNESWRLWPLESLESYKDLLSKDFEILETIQDTGGELISEHNKGNEKLGFEYTFHPDHLASHKEEMIAKIGEKNYKATVDRAQTYSLLENGKLDYNFFVCRKKV